MESDNKDCLVFKQNDLFLQGFHVMEEIRRQGKLCDVTLKVDGQSLSAHKIVLSATIPYFHAMFTLNMMESKQREITIQGIEAQALESLINFSYSGKIIIDSNSVQSLMVGASFLQLHKVRDACADFLSKRFQTYNVLGIRQFADTLSCSPLVEACEKFIHQYFYKVSLSEEFSNLSFRELFDLLKSDELYVNSEEEIFEALIRWVKKDPESRKEHLPILLSNVRLPLLSPEYLTDKVAKEQLIRASHECRDLLDEARDYYLIPERRHLLRSFRTQPRYCNYVRGQIFAIGGLAKSGDSLSTVESYDPVLGRWSLGEAMCMLRSRVGVAVMKNRLYAIGGYNGLERLETVEVFNPFKKSWFQIAPMYSRRSAVGAAALKGKLYVCGGYNGMMSLNSVECYDPEKDSWSIVTPMVKFRSAGGVLTLDGYLYALGGHDGLTIFDLVERYDPNTGKWTEVTPMLTKRCRLGVATLNGKLYACGGYDGSKFLQTMEMYDPVDNRWRTLAPMNTKRSRVALIANMGKLWAIGGYDGVSNLSTVEIYDPKLDRWTFGSPMCAHEGGVGAGVIPIC